MKDDDPRHGSVPGYRAGCRQECCRRAIATYNQMRKLRLSRGEGSSLMPALGTTRRLRALVAIGWTGRQLALEVGKDPSYIRYLMRSTETNVSKETAESINSLFDRLCMTPAPRETPGQRQGVTRALRQARLHNWSPPLAWDDIDNDPHPPSPQGAEMEMFLLHKGKKKVCQFHNIDPVAVDRALEGDFLAVGTTEEKAEVALRWRDSGRPLAELSRLTGWNVHRLLRSVSRGDAA